MFVQHPAPPSIDPVVVEALMQVQTSTVGHQRDYGFPKGLLPLDRTQKFVGCAITVRLPHLDSTALHVAADQMRPGDVLVVDQSGDNRSAFGGMVSFTAAHNGAVGAVIAGYINDVQEILELGLPVFSAGVSAHTTRILGIEGAINVPITVGGAVICPGDVIMGDADGIAVISPDEALSLASALQAWEMREPALKEKIRTGTKLSDMSGAADLFRTTEAN